MSVHDPERLSALLDGELPPDEERALRSHLKACPECQSLLATLRRVDEEGRDQPAGEPPEGYFDDFARRVSARVRREARPRAKRGRSAIRWPLWAGAAAAAAVLAVLVPRTLVHAPEAPGRESPAVPEAAPAAPAPSDEARRNHPQAIQVTPHDAMLQRGPESPPAPAALKDDRDVAGAEERGRAPAYSISPEKKEASPPSEGEDATEGYSAPPRREEARVQAPETASAAPEAEAVDRLTRQDLASSAAPAEPAPPPAPAGLGKSSEADTRALEEPLAAAEGRASAVYSESDPGVAGFRRLQARTPATAEEWRESRDSWRAWVAAHPTSRLVDEARVRVIEDGIAAWRVGGDARDLERARQDLAEYLARADARQKDRARRAVPPPGPR